MAKLKNLTGIKFIGDLSLQDADVLAQYAKRSSSILEFGAGGSTQIMSQCGAKTLVCVETDPSWAELTNKRLDQIETNTVVTFVDYTTDFDQEFDLIFVDGIPENRLDFARNTWRYLKTNGVMIFHDTRVQQEFERVVSVVTDYHNEIKTIDINALASDNISSNMTVIHKKENEPYVNWNYSEDKPLWAYGGFDSPDELLWEYDSY